MATIVVEVKGGMVINTFATCVPLRILTVDYDNDPDGQIEEVTISPVDERVARLINRYDKSKSTQNPLPDGNEKNV